MKFVRIAATIATAALLSIGATSAVAETIPTDQPLSVLAPANGTSTDAPFPTFSWVLPAGVGNSRVLVATSPKLVDGYLPESGKRWYRTEYSSTAAKVKAGDVYSPGTYYWQVIAQDLVTAGNYVSSVQKFTVKTSFSLTKLMAKTAKNGANNLPQVVVTGILKCNVAYGTKNNVELTIQVFKGTRKIGSQTRDAGDCNNMTKTKQFANWQPKPGSVTKGTKLTVKVFASFGKAKSESQTLKLSFR